MLMHVIALCAVLCVGDIPLSGSLQFHAMNSQTQVELVENGHSRSLSDKVLSRMAYDLGLKYSRVGDLGRAFDLLSTAIQFDRDNALAYAGLLSPWACLRPPGHVGERCG